MDTRDWDLCFICQTDVKNKPLLDPSTSVKLKNNVDKLISAYKEVVNNIVELNYLGQLPDYVVVDDIIGDGDNGGGGGCNNPDSMVQLMITNKVVWHKNCRSAVDGQKVQRARDKREAEDCDVNSPVKTRRMSDGTRFDTGASSSMRPLDPLGTPCIFCDEIGNRKELRRASTLGLDKRVNECAQRLGDKKLMAKLSAGDLIAINAVYHLSCLVQLYRRVETVGCDMSESRKTQVIRAHVFNELVDYVLDHRGTGVTMKMADLTTLYDKRLASLGFPDITANTTRLRKDLEREIPDLKAIKVNRCWSMAFDDDLSETIAAMKDNTSTEVSTLHKAAKILRNEYLQKKQSFTGSFSTASEAESIPPILRSFLHMLLDGPGIDQPPPESEKAKVAISIGQQIIYNSVNRRSKKPESIPRHNRDRETPSSLYVAMKLQLQSGRESLIDDMHCRGLCISYDRLRVLSTDIANSVIAHWEQIGVIVPLQAVPNVFTTGNFDNVDSNPSSTTAKTSLHGTCISIHQHFNSDLQQVDNQVNILDEAEMGHKAVRPLPAYYTAMDMDIALPSGEVQYVPLLNTNSHPIPASRSPSDIIKEGYSWLEHVEGLLSQPTLSADDWISWAAYHASITEAPTNPPSRSHMLPLYTESSNSPITVWHAMKMLRLTINHINPGQTPVVEADQPLYTLAKKLQWKYPETDQGEDSLLVTLGAMHTEKMLWAVSGDWLDGSGWTTALTNSGVSTSGRAQSFIGVHHICRTRYVHQVSVAALYTLARKAYGNYVERVTVGNGDGTTIDVTHPTIPLPFDDWLKQQCSSQPQADFWFKSLELDLLILQFVKSCRTGNFSLYKETLDALMPWVFALDHTHYARNLPIHLRDMVTLEERHPAIYVEFQNGNFMGQKSQRSFSMIPRDQMHEQLIDWLKNSAGVMENLDDPRTVRREQVVRPEIARLVTEIDGPKESDNKMHHEQYPKFQKDFKADVLALVDAFDQLGNPFMEDSGDLIDLDQSIIMPPDVVENVRKVKDIGVQKYQEFLETRITSQQEAFTATIPNTKLKLFKTALSQPRQKSVVAVMKDHQSKVTQILLAAHSGRKMDSTVFSHETSEHPPSLTKNGNMHHGTKSEILDCILPADLDNRKPETTAAVLDGAVLVQMLRPTNSVTIADYIANVFQPYVLSWFEGNNRIDIVFDVYSKTSLKSGIREQRGSGARRRVTASTKIPGNWAAFLRVDLNKQELFLEIANSFKTLILPQGKQLFITSLDSCETCSPAGGDIENLTPCSHEEADTRVYLHVASAVSAGHRRIIIRTSDSDVVILGIFAFISLEQRLEKMWIAFGLGRNFRYIPVHDVTERLGPSVAKALPAFHALTGCDTTSAFFGKGKKSAWSIWQNFPDLTLPLESLSSPDVTQEIVTAHMPVFQRFVMMLYGVFEDNIATVDDARCFLFINKGKDFHHMPPSSDALYQHMLRVAYQSGHVWGNMFVKSPTPVSPTTWGWVQSSPDAPPTPHYVSTSVISPDLPRLVSCKCKLHCKAPCKCCVNTQPCMSLCRCQGMCTYTTTLRERQDGSDED